MALEYIGPVLGPPTGAEDVGDASKRPAPSRGQVFVIPASSPQLFVAPQALRLDQGSWDIRAARLLPSGSIANAPSQISPSFPVQLLVEYGVGAAVWSETSEVTARGCHIVRSAELMQVRVRLNAALGAAEERVLVAAQKVVVPTQPARRFLSRSQVVAPAGILTVPVVTGATRVQFIGGELDAPVFGTWRDANLVSLGRVLVVPVAGIPVAPLWVPPLAASILWDVLPTGATIGTIWEIEQ